MTPLGPLHALAMLHTGEGRIENRDDAPPEGDLGDTPWLAALRAPPARTSASGLPLSRPVADQPPAEIDMEAQTKRCLALIVRRWPEYIVTSW